jgi:HAMP domain-containing protein
MTTILILFVCMLLWFAWDRQQKRINNLEELTLRLLDRIEELEQDTAPVAQKLARLYGR